MEQGQRRYMGWGMKEREKKEVRGLCSTAVHVYSTLTINRKDQSNPNRNDQPQASIYNPNRNDQSHPNPNGQPKPYLLGLPGGSTATEQESLPQQTTPAPCSRATTRIKQKTINEKTNEIRASSTGVKKGHSRTLKEWGVSK